MNSDTNLVERLRALEPERTRNSEFGPMIYAEAADRIEALSTNSDLIGKLVEALEPFANCASPSTNTWHESAEIEVELRDCRRARTTLSEARKAMKGDEQ